MWLKHWQSQTENRSSCYLCLPLCSVLSGQTMWLLYFSWKLSINIKTSSETGDIVYKDRDTKCSLVMKKWSNHHPTLTYFWNHSQQRTIRWRENAIEQDFPAKWRMLCPTSRRRPSPHTITSPVGAQPYYWTGVASVP